MVANFAINNNPHSTGGRKQETLRNLAKKVIENAGQKERKIDYIVDTRSEYTTKEYIPAETYIYSISAQACQTDRLKTKLNFLNNQAAIKTLASKSITIEDDEFLVEIDDSKNIFAA